MDSGTVVPESTTSSSCPSSPRPAITLTQPKKKKPAVKNAKPFRVLRSLLRSFPIISPACRFHGTLPRPNRTADGHISGATRTAGTLFGHRRSRITLAIQESPRSIPILLLELATPTGKFMQEMGTDHLRIALECEKKAADKTKLIDEPLWTAFINGRKIGYAVRREPSENDLEIMQLLYTVSMGAGVLPDDMTDPVEGEMTYMRAHFDRVVGSKDSETFYMLNPDGNNGSELSIFFVRV
ncbi:protein MIZU-KUSSEI 1-like [Canna indica]|uniref:Protein MIZU-KUSSEI 1-like n=1 Tax=Canna indica TaxID=4628 RepID=A0AAQ3QPC7_9LILI|nr:protein MIZU-KUSSEI 1-like [Canna indica]